MAETGYTAQEKQRWETEAQDFDRVAQESEAMAQVRQKLAQRANAPSELASAYNQLQQSQLQKQAMRAAFARGYNPGSQRNAMEAAAESQLDISSKVQQIEAEEHNRAMAAYGQILQNKQKMALAAEEAKKAYVMGHEKLALQALDNARRAEVAAKGVAMAEAQAKADANARFTSALIGAAGSLTAYGANAGWFKAAPATTPVVSAPQAGQGQNYSNVG